MNVHHSSLFRYSDYQDDMAPLVNQVDKGIFLPLQERTCESIKTFQNTWPLVNHSEVKYEDGISKGVLTQEWPLWEHGASSLDSVEQITKRPSPNNREIAHCFLIMLGEYLEPCPSPLGNWIVLNHVLAQYGWQQQDCDLLFRGLPTSQLLKPEESVHSPWPLKNEDPYWLWLHPGRARSGWLPLGEVTRLHSKLVPMEQRVMDFEIRRIPNINVDNPIVLADYGVYLDSAFRDTVAMLSTAQEKKLGLFMSITTYA